MGTTFSTKLLSEKGAGFIQVDFTDEAGVVVIPNADTIKWTLTTKPLRGIVPTVINSREQVAITSLSTINIPLEGNDLALLAAEAGEPFVERVLTVEYQYNSTLGNNIDANAQHVFEIENLYYITD